MTYCIYYNHLGNKSILNNGMKSYLKFNVCKTGDRELPYLVILFIIYEFIILLITNNDFLIKVNEIKSSFRKCRNFSLF